MALQRSFDPSMGINVSTPVIRVFQRQICFKMIVWSSFSYNKIEGTPSAPHSPNFPLIWCLVSPNVQKRDRHPMLNNRFLFITSHRHYNRNISLGDVTLASGNQTPWKSVYNSRGYGQFLRYLCFSTDHNTLKAWNGIRSVGYYTNVRPSVRHARVMDCAKTMQRTKNNNATAGNLISSSRRGIDYRTPFSTLKFRGRRPPRKNAFRLIFVWPQHLNGSN